MLRIPGVSKHISIRESIESIDLVSKESNIYAALLKSPERIDIREMLRKKYRVAGKCLMYTHLSIHSESAVRGLSTCKSFPYALGLNAKVD